MIFRFVPYQFVKDLYPPNTRFSSPDQISKFTPTIYPMDIIHLNWHIISTLDSSYEQTNIFLYACAATVIAAIIFSKGSPYRQPLYKNGQKKS